jgi:hypothetical protein
MIVKPWSNGTIATGIKIRKIDRDEYFDTRWKIVLIDIEGVEYELK